MNNNEYKCAVCLEVFEKGWSDEEAEKEREENGWKGEDCELVCDDCHKKLMQFETANPGVAYKQ